VTPYRTPAAMPVVRRRPWWRGWRVRVRNRGVVYVCAAIGQGSAGMLWAGSAQWWAAAICWVASSFLLALHVVVERVPEREPKPPQAFEWEGSTVYLVEPEDDDAR
jgi:hypothetical protein